jgi:hypothetical protein
VSRLALSGARSRTRPRPRLRSRLWPRAGRAAGAGAALAGLLAAGLLAAACAEPGQDTGSAGEPVPGLAGEPVLITGSSVGCLVLDATVDEVARDCRVVGDTTLYLEGMPQQALRVDVGGDTALAEIVEERVWRISVSSPGPVTVDSVGVGTPLSRLAAMPDPRISAGEGRYFLTTPAHCGLSFGIRGLPFGAGPWSAEELAAMPDSVRVERILITGGC